MSIERSEQKNPQEEKSHTKPKVNKSPIKGLIKDTLSEYPFGTDPTIFNDEFFQKIVEARARIAEQRARKEAAKD